MFKFLLPVLLVGLTLGFTEAGQQQLAASPIKRSLPDAEQQEVGFRGGQLESFSSHATGLGDMEAQDELKKMTKRGFDSVEQNPLVVKRRKGLFFADQERDMKEAKRSSASLMRQSGAIQRLLQNRADRAINFEPILIARRTGDQLIDGRILGLGQGQVSDEGEGSQQQPEQEEFVEPGLAEYDSGISLLTTRKMQPLAAPASFLYANQEPADGLNWRSKKERLFYNILGRLAAAQGQQEENLVNSVSERPPVGSKLFLEGTSEPRIKQAIEMILKNRKLRGGSQEEIETQQAMPQWLDSNFLPRIARSTVYQMRR